MSDINKGKIKCPVCGQEWGKGVEICEQCGWDLESRTYLAAPSQEEQNKWNKKLEIARRNWQHLKQSKVEVEEEKKRG
ncbi:MAG: hypothetical protein HQK89_17620 [Nitrospirae bacterium]|nr:hypothetical protein [Nitrospirota bacterium]